jgi:ferrous iron transport protein A
MIPLTSLPAGVEATIVEFVGGHGMSRRLSSMGLIPGKKVTRISTMLMKGPVHVKVGQAEIALGQGMARHVLVSIKDT